MIIIDVYKQIMVVFFVASYARIKIYGLGAVAIVNAICGRGYCIKTQSIWHKTRNENKTHKRTKERERETKRHTNQIILRCK